MNKDTLDGFQETLIGSFIKLKFIVIIKSIKTNTNTL